MWENRLYNMFKVDLLGPWCDKVNHTPNYGRESGHLSMTSLAGDVIATALVVIGTLNWGLAGAFHLDLVAAVFGMKFGETSELSTVVYSLVGPAGLYLGPHLEVDPAPLAR